MSATAAPPPGERAEYKEMLDLRETVARIDRAQEETRKYVQEQNKLAAERDELAAEARKLDRDRGLAPWQATAVTAGGLAALAASLLALAKSMAWL